MRHRGTGWRRPDIVPAIYAGAENLQALVDAFNALGASEVLIRATFDLDYSSIARE